MQMIFGNRILAMRGAGAREVAAGPRRSVRAAALPDFFKGLQDFFDYSSWAPKSSRIWRLQQYQYPEADSLERGAPGGADEQEGQVSPQSMRILQDRLAQLREGGDSSGASGRSSGSSIGQPRLDASSSSKAEVVQSFSDADDDEMAWALNRRISEISLSTGEWGDTVEEEAVRRPLTGQELRQLLLTKYGKLYDMSFAKRSIPGKTFVALNIMWLHLEQRSFQLTPEQYEEKLDGVAQLVNILGQTDKVRAFMSSPAKSQKGLPRRPVVGTAISIQLDLDEAQVAEWFGAGYD